MDDTLKSELDADVAVLGGGLAGLTLAVHLKLSQPDLRVCVLEKGAHPAPEAAHKVGESSVEIGAGYFADALKMRAHMEANELPKFGLRFFFRRGDNAAIERRAEHGPPDWLGYSEAPHTFQLDRGRFENALRERAVELGAHFVDECAVRDIELGDPHRILAERRGERLTLTARWVVDASGRRSLLKKKLGLAEPSSHKANAAWFRVKRELDIDAWSDDPAWHARMTHRRRRYSTNHLLGRGYWVWLIPLGSGSTSVGIVADDAIHPFSAYRSFDRALDWLRTHEPQCAKAVEECQDTLQDFLALKHFSHSCKQVYSPDRWALTGESGAFLDPFYSPGSDFIAMSNRFVNWMIRADREGEDIAERVALYNDRYIQLFRHSLLIYDGQYPVMGGHESMLGKLIWDAAVYIAFLLAINDSGRLTELDFLRDLEPVLERLVRLQRRMQPLFRDWAEREAASELEDRYFPLAESMEEPMLRRFKRLEDPDQVIPVLWENLGTLEQIAAWMFRRAATTLPHPPEPRPLDPYAISLDPASWDADGLFADAGVEPGDLAPGLDALFGPPT